MRELFDRRCVLRRLHPPALAAAAGLALAACSDRGAVIVCAAADRDVANPVFAEFTRRTGIDALAKYGSEAAKTVGLARALLAEAFRPRCDVFWNNEIVNTLCSPAGRPARPLLGRRLRRHPPAFKDANGLWHGFGARARVFLVNTEKLAGRPPPASILDVADPAWAGEAAMAKPLFGTTATHMAALRAALGGEKARGLFRRMRENGLAILPGDRDVARAVADGRATFGLADTDDALAEIEAGAAVGIVYPDASGHGTLFIPNTAALVAGGPNPDAGRAFLEFLLSPEVESRLAEGKGGQIPLNPAVNARPRVRTPAGTPPMLVDWQAVSRQFPGTLRLLEEVFLR